MFWEEDAEKLDDKSLEEIWLGAYMTRVRGALVEGRGLPPYCKGCHSHIAVRSCEFRAGLSARAWERWSILPWTDRTRLLSVRLMQSLRSRGMRATLRRAGEWMRVMGKKGRG